MSDKFHLSLTHEELFIIQKGIDAIVNEGYDNITVINGLKNKIIEEVRYYYGDDK